MLSQSEHRKPVPQKKNCWMYYASTFYKPWWLLPTCQIKHTVGLCFLIQEYLGNRLRQRDQKYVSDFDKWSAHLNLLFRFYAFTVGSGFSVESSVWRLRGLRADEHEADV